MFRYECSICGALCDPGELEKESCFECRSKAVDRQSQENCRTIRETNQLIRARYAQQANGQRVMEVS